jgi:VWFA-related protein
MPGITRRFSPALMAVVLATAQSPGFSQVQLPQERGADLVTVDFSVVSSDGRPITDLRASDVSIRIGGKIREIRSLQLINAVDTPAPAAVSTSPEPFGTNAVASEGRTMVLVIDDDSFRVGRETLLREAVDSLLSGVSPRDRLSLVTMPYGGVKVPPTTDHARIRTALLKIIGQASGTETGSELACRTRRTLETLVGYLDGNLGIRESPVWIMFITGGLAAPRRDAPVSLAPGMCELRVELYREVGVAAGAARAHFYVIQPGDALAKPSRLQTENIAGVGFLGSDNPLEGIEHLAGVTGGKMLQLTGSAQGAFGRVLNESSAYYLAAVEPEKSDRTGRSNRLDVRLTRPNVELRARPNITFARRETVGAPPLNPSPRDMLGVATVFRDLPLRASAFAALDTDGKTMRIVTLAEPVDPQVRFSSLVAALFDRDGKLVSNWSATPQELQRSLVIGAMPAEPGAYRMRVAAIDTTGRAGTADYELDAEIVQTGKLKLSSVVLGLWRDGQFTPRLQFSAEPVAIAYVEMYGAPPGTQLVAAVELAATLNGPALLTLPLVIEGAGESRYVARGAVPIGGLPPGDYVVRALVGVEGQPMTRVLRTLRKVTPSK